MILFTQAATVSFVTGAVALGAVVVALFFARFWRQTGDRFFAIFTVYNNSADASNGVGFAIYPQGLGAGFSSDALTQEFTKGK